MRRALPLALALCGGLASCGDDDVASPSVDLQPPPDLTMPDLAPYPDLVPSLGVGLPCPNGNECMAGLMPSGIPLIFIRHGHTAALASPTDFNASFFQLGHGDGLFIGASREQSGFVKEVGQICT